jgi:hypothetical protein
MDHAQKRPASDLRETQRLLGISPLLEPRDTLLTLKLATSDSIWEALLAVQYSLSKPAELSYLYTDPDFQRARDVLEIGFGRQRIVGGLHSYFGDKQFREVALSTDLILGGKQKTRTFLEAIAAQAGGRKFDYLVLRAVLQKVSQLGLFIETVAQYLKPSGRLLIIDAWDSLIGWTPQVAALEKMFARLREEQSRSGVGRTASEKVHRRASLYRLRPQRVDKRAVSSHGEADLRNFYVYFLLLSEAIGRAYGRGSDPTDLLQDLDRWILDPSASCQFGLHFVQLARV